MRRIVADEPLRGEPETTRAPLETAPRPKAAEAGMMIEESLVIRHWSLASSSPDGLMTNDE
jgi:hypothetical protein